MALCSVVPELHGDGTRSTASSAWSVPNAAEELWRALHAPLRIRWEVPLGGNFVAAVSAKICQESSWPPSHVQLQLNCKESPSASWRKDGEFHQQGLEIQVPSSVSSQQLAELLTASCALAGFNVDAPAPLSPQELHAPTTPPDVIDQCEERKISQLQCLTQWHHDVCGHHALFNLRCLLRNELESLTNEQRFWRQVIADIQRLAKFGEVSGSWPKSRVVGGVADEVHLRHLVQQDDDLRGQITLASSLESLKEALHSLRLQSGQAHGFLLGAATHWYSAAVVPADDPRIYFFDSYNVPVLSLKTNEDIDQVVDELLIESRSHSMERLKRDPSWTHRPKDHIEEALEKGVEEWWKGVRKASMFWLHKPLEVRRELKRMDLCLVRDFLQLLLGWLRDQIGSSLCPPSEVQAGEH